MWHVEYIFLIRRSVYVSVLLLHLKNDISLPFPLYQRDIVYSDQQLGAIRPTVVLLWALRFFYT